MVEMFRQGDVLLMKIKELPKNAKVKSDNVILEGEVSGHAHVIEAGVGLMLNENLYVNAGAETKLVHDEHGPIEIPEGNYKVVRQREFVPPNREQEKKVWEYVHD